jgi:hypothetical protein
MARRMPAAAGLSAIGLAVVAGLPAVAADGPADIRVPAATAGSCAWTGQVTVAPGLTFSFKDFRFTLDGDIGACKMPNGETRTGKIVAKEGAGNGGCGTTNVETPFTVVWNGNRSTSSGHAYGVTFGPSGFVAGELDEGEFAGTPFETVIFLDPQGPLLCGTEGVTRAVVHGQITFHPLPSAG